MVSDYAKTKEQVLDCIRIWVQSSTILWQRGSGSGSSTV